MIIMAIISFKIGCSHEKGFVSCGRSLDTFCFTSAVKQQWRYEQCHDILGCKSSVSSEIHFSLNHCYWTKIVLEGKDLFPVWARDQPGQDLAVLCSECDDWTCLERLQGLFLHQRSDPYWRKFSLMFCPNFPLTNFHSIIYNRIS